MLLLWWLYLFQGANCMPVELCDGRIHPPSVLVGFHHKIKGALEKSDSVFIVIPGETRHAAAEWLGQSATRLLARLRITAKSPPSLFSALSAFSPLSLPKYFCSSPLPISLTLSQNKQQVVLKHSTVHLIRTSIRTKLQIKQLHYAYWHSPCGFSWINLFVSPLQHCCEWL